MSLLARTAFYFWVSRRTLWTEQQVGLLGLRPPKQCGETISLLSRHVHIITVLLVGRVLRQEGESPTAPRELIRTLGSVQGGKFEEPLQHFSADTQHSAADSTSDKRLRLSFVRLDLHFMINVLLRFSCCTR